MDRLSCGTCKHITDGVYKHYRKCTAQDPCWGECVETTRQVFRDGSTADLAPNCEAYEPNKEVSGGCSTSAELAGSEGDG